MRRIRQRLQLLATSTPTGIVSVPDHRMRLLNTRSTSSSSKPFLQCIANPTSAFLTAYFNKYVLAWNRTSPVKRDEEYAPETVSSLLEFQAPWASVTAYVIVEKEEGEEKGNIVAGTLLVHVKNEAHLARLSHYIGSTVLDAVKREVRSLPFDWQEQGLYFQKGSFKLTNKPFPQIYKETFLKPDGLHLYSTLAGIHAKTEKMVPEVQFHCVGKEKRLGGSLEYTYYLWRVQQQQQQQKKKQPQQQQPKGGEEKGEEEGARRHEHLSRAAEDVFNFFLPLEPVISSSICKLGDAIHGITTTSSKIRRTTTSSTATISKAATNSQESGVI